MSLQALRWLAHGLSGQDLAIQHLQAEASAGLPPRPVLTPSHLLLPADDGDALNADARHRLHRASVAHAMAHLKHSRPALPSAGLKPMTVALASALEDARVERLLMREHPGVRAWFLPCLHAAMQPEGLGFAALLSRLDLALMDPAYQADDHWVDKARTLFERQATELENADGFKQIAMTLVHDLGQMRVAFRPGQYSVPAPYRDDNSFLWQHEDQPEAEPPPALELEVPRQRLMQARPPTQANEGESGQARVEDEAMSRHLYPEWHHRLALLRQDWCTVIDKRPSWRTLADPDQAGKADVLPMPLRQSPRLSRGRRLRRQLDGDELDLNAAVAHMAEHRARRSGDPRLFTRPGHREDPASILVLLDLSQSTNDCLGEAGPTFLELEKKAALMLAGAAQAAGDRIAIHGFSSNTRAEVSYYRLIGFGASIDAQAKALLSAAPGRHSTRLGAALRHATACLAGESNDLKSILVLSDGAPSDIDVHDPRHLVEDARHAVQAARKLGIQVHGLSVDRQASAEVRRIFGARHAHTLDRPAALPLTLCALHRSLNAA